MKKRATMSGPGASKRRHPAPAGHEVKNKKAGTWIDKPSKEKKELTPYSGPSIQIGVINIGSGTKGIDKEIAKNYVPINVKVIDKNDYFELWSIDNKK